MQTHIVAYFVLSLSLSASVIILQILIEALNSPFESLLNRLCLFATIKDQNLYKDFKTPNHINMQKSFSIEYWGGDIEEQEVKYSCKITSKMFCTDTVDDVVYKTSKFRRRRKQVTKKERIRQFMKDI